LSPEVTSSLVGYWKFNEGLGTRAYDESLLDIDAILHNASELDDDAPESNELPEWVEGVMVIPNAPQNLIAESSIENVTLTWDLGSEANLEKYFIYRDTEPGASTLLDSVNVPEWYNPDSRGEPEPISYIDLSTLDGTTYYYRITALNAENYESTSSLEVTGASGFGCMDPIASNYNPDATVDDGSCQYDGNYALVFEWGH
jgi:hypothetical protein